MTDTQRDEIKSRLIEAQTRDAARREGTLIEKIEDGALEAKDRFVSFAKEHPVATVAGGLVLGVAIAAMFKGPRRAAMRGGARAAGLAAIGSEIALGFASQLLDSAQEAGRGGARQLGELGENLGERASGVREKVGSNLSRILGRK